MTLPKLRNTLFATTCLLGMGSPAFAKIEANLSFTPAIASAGSPIRVTIALQNSDVIPAGGAGFSLAFPEHIVLRNGGGLVNNCGGTADLAMSGAELGLALTGGAIPEAESGLPGNCSISFDAVVNRADVFNVGLMAGAVTANVAGEVVSNSSTSDASLTSTMVPLAVGINTGLANNLQGREVTWRDFRLTNANNIAITGLDFPIDMPVINPDFRLGNVLSNSCGGNYTRTEIVGSETQYRDAASQVMLSGASVPANGSCTLRVEYRGSRKAGQSYYSDQNQTVISSGTMISDQNISNATSPGAYAGNKTGHQVDMLIDGAVATETDLDDAEDLILTYNLKNHNILPAPGLAVQIQIPSDLEIMSMDAGDCGSLTQNAAGALFNLTSKPAPDQVAGLDVGECLARITLRAKAAGKHVVKTATASLGTASYGLTHIPGDSVTINVNGSRLGLETTFDRLDVRASDWSVFTANLSNKSDEVIENITFDNNVSTSIKYGQIDPVPMLSNGCGGAANISADFARITISGFDLAARASCQISYRVRFGSASYRATGVGMVTLNNVIGPADISYEAEAGGRENWGSTSAASANIRASTDIGISFSPNIIRDGGTSRFRFWFKKVSDQGHGSKDIWFYAALPDGLRIADVPNFTSSCGGVLVSTPGATELRISGAALKVLPGQSEAICNFYVDMTAPLLAVGETTKSLTVMTRGYSSLPEASLSYDAQDEDLVGDIGRSFKSVNNEAILTLERRVLGLGLSISGGDTGNRQVKVTLSNVTNGTLVLNNVNLPLDFSSSGIRLAAAPDARFTVKTGAASACSGAQFVAVPGAAGIEIKSAKIAGGAECDFTFQISATGGGSHAINIPVGAVRSTEGVTNDASATASMVLGYSISASIGFVPNTIGVNGVSEINIEIINGLEDNGSNDLLGQSPSLIFVIPANMVPIGPAATSCGGVASFTATELRLNGGSFPADSSCRVSLPVRVTTAAKHEGVLQVGALRTVDGTTNILEMRANVTALGHPVLSQFSVSSMTGVGRVGTVSMQLRNPNGAALNPSGLSGIAFTADLGSDVELVEGAMTSGCSGFTYRPVGNTVEVSGVSLNSSANCRVNFTLSSDAGGDHVLNFGDVHLSTFEMASPADLPVTFRVAADPIVTLTPEVADSEIPFDLAVTLENPNAFPVGLTSFSLPLPAVPGALTSSVAGVMSNCGGASLTAPAGAISIGLSGGSLPASGTCDIDLGLVASKPGIYSLTPAMTMEYGTLSLAPTAVTVQGTVSELVATRSLRVLADQVPGLTDCAELPGVSSGSRAMPGACVEVVVRIENPASEIKTARDIAAREILSADMALASSDAGDVASLTEDEAGLTASILSLAPGASASFSYRAMIQ